MYESFEKTYPCHPFAELVGLGIALAGLLARASEKQTHKPGINRDINGDSISLSA